MTIRSLLATATISLFGFGLVSCTGTPEVERDDLFFQAVAQGDLETVRKLVTAGTDVNRTLPNGRTALHLANDPDIIALLIRQGANPHRLDNRDSTPLKRLLDSAFLFPYQRESKRVLLSAFLDAGVEFPIEGAEGRYFLHRSALVGHRDLVEHLLNRGVDSSSLNPTGGTLLHSVASGGLEAIARALLQEGSDPNATDRYGMTPLHFAAQEGHPGLLPILVHSGAEVNSANLGGKTAMDLARDFGHGPGVKALLDLDAHQRDAVFTELHGPYLGLKPPGLQPEIFAPGIVSTHHYDHSAAIVSSDGQSIFWSPVYTSRGDFIFSMRKGADGWSTPEILPFCAVGSTSMYPTLSKDGRKLFFTSDRALPGQEPGIEMNIWVSEREGDQWSEPELVGFPGGNEYGLSIADNGTLVFMADYEGGEGSSDLYRSTFENGRYASPENLGPAINSKYYEDEPFIAPDESYLLFASLRPQEPNQGRLYISQRNKDRSWSQPQAFSSRLQMPGQFRFPQISPDGKFLFFANNQNGNWDIYWVEAAILPELNRD